jgi:hypothetical protein
VISPHAPHARAAASASPTAAGRVMRETCLAGLLGDSRTLLRAPLERISDDARHQEAT